MRILLYEIYYETKEIMFSFRKALKTSSSISMHHSVILLDLKPNPQTGQITPVA